MEKFEIRIDATACTSMVEGLIWRNHSLAIDGVIFREMLDDEMMRISCKMNPPGGWGIEK